MRTAAYLGLLLIPCLALGDWKLWPRKRACEPECPPVCEPQCEMIPICPTPKPEIIHLYEEEEEGEEESAEQPAAFSAPPAVGETAGESISIGIRGPAIRVPEINFELPSIRLPSLVLFRRAPEFRVEAARAPLTYGQPAPYLMGGPGGNVGVGESAPAPKKESGKTKTKVHCDVLKECQTLREENRKLSDELEQRDNELRELHTSVEELKSLVTTLVQKQTPKQQPTSAEPARPQPRIVEVEVHPAEDNTRGRITRVYQPL